MKRIRKYSMLLATGLSLCALLAACDATPSDTIPATDSTTTAITTTTGNRTTTDQSNPDTPTPTTTLAILEFQTEWHYKTFLCPYDSTTVGGSFDPETDEMAKWLAEQGDQWYIHAIDEMKTWDITIPPLGDRFDFSTGISTDWQGDRNGIILYTTFNLTAEDLKKIQSAGQNDIYMELFYDNTISIFINGTHVYEHNNGTDGWDWNDELSVVPFNSTSDIRSILREGENTVVVSLKNTYGGREFIMCMEAKIPQPQQ